MTTEIVTQEKSGLPMVATEIMSKIAEVKDNFESVDTFRLPRAKMTAEGFELLEGEAPITVIEGVIIHTKKTNVYYDMPFNVNDPKPPTCMSMDGVLPDKSIAIPVSTKCKGCPMAEFGTNQMKSGKACRNLKPLYMLLSDEAIMPRQLTVTPASLKAANQYLMDLTERGFAYRKVKTRIEAYKKNPRDTYMVLKFSMIGKLDAQASANVDFLKAQWLPVMENQVIDQVEFEHVPEAQNNASL